MSWIWTLAVPCAFEHLALRNRSVTNHAGKRTFKSSPRDANSIAKPGHCFPTWETLQRLPWTSPPFGHFMGRTDRGGLINRLGQPLRAMAEAVQWCPLPPLYRLCFIGRG